MKNTLNQKEKILERIQSALESGFSETLLVSKSESGQVIHSVPRVLFTLEGESEVEYFSDNGNIERKTVRPGCILYSAVNGYLYSDNLKGFPCKGISLSFYSDFIRYMLVDFDGVTTPPTNSDIILHSDTSLPRPGLRILDVLDEIAETGECVEQASELLSTLLRISIKTVRRGKEKSMPRFSPSYEIWYRISCYIRSHFNEELTRGKVAKAFFISPSHLSHLFAKYANKNFTATLEDARLEHAAMLLRRSELSVEEISYQCNFKYPSYFIKRFKNKFTFTPMSYRSRGAI